jgi:hypothetical protein
MPKQPETVSETVPETAKHISIEMVRLFRPIAFRSLRSGSAMPSAPLAAHRSGLKGIRTADRKASLRVREEARKQLVPSDTQITAKPFCRGRAYIQALHRRDKRLSLGQWLGHDELGNDCEALILLDNLIRIHRFEQPMLGAKPRNGAIFRDCARKDPAGVPGGSKTPAVQTIDLLPLIRGSSEKTCCHRATPNFGGGSWKNLVHQ